MAWYWTRIWVEVTPARVLWWPGSDLSRPPLVWTPQIPFPVAPSDPAPSGAGAGSWSTPQPASWQSTASKALVEHGLPVLTGLDADGWPLPLRVRSAERTERGFRLALPAGVDFLDGPACLTVHTHGVTFDSQSNVGITGTCRVLDDVVEFDADRVMANFDVPRNPIRRAVHMLSAGRKLKQRLESEAARRGQRVPRYDELGVGD